MFADDVATWLKSNPDFFMEHSDVFATMRVPHPEGGHAISMVERQLISLRERSGQLEQRIETLIGYGQQNDVLADKLHRLTLALLRAPDLATTVAVVNESMQSDFEIPHSMTIWWGDGSPDAFYPTDVIVSGEFRGYVMGLDRPYVGPTAAHESRTWLIDGAGERASSFAYLPLTAKGVEGVLFLASDDPLRFTSDMAVDVLFRLSNIVSVAIARFMPNRSAHDAGEIQSS
jgi:uncharacterized protein